jgi:hypothetical protein
MTEAVLTSEASVCSNEITWRCIPEGCNLHTRRRENLKYHKRKKIFTKDCSKRVDTDRETSIVRQRKNARSLAYHMLTHR